MTTNQTLEHPSNDKVESVASNPKPSATAPNPQVATAETRPLASSPLVLSLLIVLLAAVFVQGALLVGLYLKQKAPEDVVKSISDTPALVAKSDDDDPSDIPLSTGSPLSKAPLGSLLTDDFFSDNWQPFAEMARMREQMDSLFDDSFTRFRSLPGFDENWLTLGSNFSGDAAITEKDGKFVVTLDVPGADEATLDIRLENGVLSVAGTREETNEERDDNSNVFRKSQSSSKFQRSFTLPGEVDSAGMKSDYKDGVLTITIPKK